MISPDESKVLRKLSSDIFLEPRLITPLAFRLGEDASQDDLRWVRFAGHAAILLELERKGLVEGMAPLPADTPATFDEYRTSARVRYNASLDDRLQAWHDDPKWQPVREAMAHLYMLEHRVVLDEHDDTTEELFRRHYASQTDPVVDHIQAVNELSLSRGWLVTPEEIREEASSPNRLKKMAHTNIAASTLLADDLGRGDPDGVLTYEHWKPRGERFNIKEDLNDLPVGRSGKTVGQLDRESGVIPLPCAAILGSKIIPVLVERIAGETYQSGLLGKPSTS